MDESARNQLRQLEKEQLIDIIFELRAVLEGQGKRIQALEDQVAKNSRNSSKPPSSDGLRKKPRSLREKGQRKIGGQDGHEGQTLKMVATPEHQVVHLVTRCSACDANLMDVEALRIEKRQVFDVPEVRLEVTEHQGEVKCCPNCGTQVKATFPKGVERGVQYGRRLQAQAVYLTSYQLLPLARTSELLGDFYGHAPSQAFILESMASLQQHLEAPLARIRAQLVQADVMHNDETGLRVEGKLNWLHVASTKTLTYYGVHPKRGQEAVRAIGLLANFKGVSVHDGYVSYFQFEQCQHALCNAHHLRELRFIAEQYQQTWANGMMQLLCEAKQEVADCDLQNSLAAERLHEYHRRYDALLTQGFEANLPPETPPPQQRGRKKQSAPKNLLDRLQKYKQETLAFIADFRIPFDNNLAERDVRMMKVKQKISGTFRTRGGAELFCDIRSYLSTLRKQGHSLIQALLDALLGLPLVPA